MQIVSLPFISQDAYIRYTTVPSLLLSIVDSIKALSGKNNNDAAQDFRRICAKFPAFESKYTTYKFPGQGQRETPVADLETVLMIMQHVPGPLAQQYREWTAKVLREHIARDKTNPLNHLASEERLCDEQKHLEAMEDQGIEVINIKATVESMGIDERFPFYQEYQRHLTEVAKENMREMASLQMKLAKHRASNQINVEKSLNEIEIEKAAVEKEKAKTERLLQVQHQKQINLQILNTEMEYTERRMEQERRSKEMKEMRAIHASNLERQRLNALKLKNERVELKTSLASKSETKTATEPLPNPILGEKRKRGRPRKVIDTPFSLSSD